MKPAPPPPSPPRRYLPPLIAAVLLTSLLISSSFLLSPTSPLAATPTAFPRFVESKLFAPPSPASAVPRLAYLISGSVSDLLPIQRALRALYHPANRYLLHLDRASSPADRLALAAAVTTDPVYSHFNNVNLVSRANLITYRGPTMVSNTLHAAALLLRDGDWDWFINLSASDYPLLTQDDLMYALAGVPRGLNFLEHTSDIGWKESQRARPVIIDPGFYSSHKSEVFWVTEQRSVPTAFKLFTGSAWMMLSHQFIDFCVWGWDNLPRTVLMYYANFLSSPEGYFHTVICNVPEFRNTTVNHDLHYIYWDNPPKQHPHFLTVEDFARMVDSNAPFARKFGRDDPVLEKIDKELLGRDAGGFVPGGWFDGFVKNTSDPNYFVGDVSELRPGAGADRLKRLITGLLTAKDFDEKHCI